MKEKEELKTVSVIVPILNEEKYIEKFLETVLAQDYEFNNIELIFVDGNSSDKTIELLEKKMKNCNVMYKLLVNSKKKTPISVNIGIMHAKNDIIIRLDAHSEYPKNYISKCVYYLNKTGADNVGCLFDAQANGILGKAISNVLSSKFGVGNSRFRLNAESGYVDTVPYGTFRRELFEKIGFFNEELLRSEDNELNYRIRRSGGKVYLFNDIAIIYHPRNTIPSLAKMAFGNGKYVIYTSYFIPGSVGIRHLVPFAFVLSLIIGIMSMCLNVKWITYLFLFELLLYLVLDLFFSFKKVSDGVIQSLISIILYPLFHISYGIGSIFGIFKIVKWKLKNEKNIRKFTKKQ